LVTSFYYALGFTSSSIVGNLIGQRKPTLAHRYAKISLIIGFIPSGLVALFLIFGGNHLIIKLYTNLPEVVKLGSEVLFLYAFGTMFDT